MKISTSYKYLVLFLLISIFTFSLSGCYNSQNIDRLAYIVAIGLDIGENNKLRISFQISIPNSSSGESGSSQSSESVVNAIECSSIDSGINLLNSYLSKEVNLSHCKVIVFSEKFAYGGISESLYTLMNDIQIRPDCNIVVSRCDAEYFLKNSEPLLEKLSAKYYEIAPSSSEYTAYTQSVTLSKFFSNYNDSCTECYAILGGVNSKSTHDTASNISGEEKDADNKANETLIDSKPNIENMGLAVFNGDKLAGELSGIETMCHQIVSNYLDTCNITIPSPFENNKNVSLRLRLKNKTKNKVYLVDNSPYITTKVNLEARILSMDENSDYLESENIKLLEEYANSYLESKIYEYLYKTSKTLNSDIDGFGKYVIHNFLTWNDWKSYNWLENYKNSFFNVDVNISVKSGYLILES